MTSETMTPDTGLDDLLNRHFPGKVVRKDLTKLVKEGANVPVYVLEYLLGSYCASNDEAVIAGRPRAPSRRCWPRTTSGPTKPRRSSRRSGSVAASRSSTR